MSETEEKLLTVKEYAAENHVSRQSVNSKINRHKDELKGHVFIINGRKMLSEVVEHMADWADKAIEKVAEKERADEQQRAEARKKRSGYCR